MNAPQRVRVAGTVYAVGGLLWLVLTAVLAVVFGGDPPGTSPAFVPSQVLYIILQVLLLGGFVGVYWSHGVRGVFGQIAFGLGVLGHLVFVAGEAHSLFIGANSDLVALGALVSSVGILLTGIAVLVAKGWQGWPRWMPLLTGAYPFVFMFPFLIIYGDPSSFAIAGWGVPRLLLGLAICAQANAMPTTTSPTDVKLSQRSA